MTANARTQAAATADGNSRTNSRREDAMNYVITGKNPVSRLNVLIFVAATVNILSSTPVQACSMPRGWRPQSDVEKLLAAQHVLYATVLRTIPDERFSYSAHGENSVYTAEIDVHCILKGELSERIVNITQAGYVPGWCHSTNLKVGQRYVLMVRSFDDDYISNSGELAADTEEQINQLTVACGLQQIYPIGVDADNSSVKCPIIATSSNCTSSKDFPTAVAEIDEEYNVPEKNSSLPAAADNSSPRRNTGNSWHCQSTTIFYLISTLFIAFVLDFIA